MSRGDARPPRGRIEAIHVASAESEPVRGVGEVRALAGRGLEGDRYFNREGFWPDDGEVRDLTLVEAEEIERLAVEHGIALRPGETRRNLTTRGIRLGELVGRRLRVGEVVCEGARLCEPCAHLQTLVGKPILRPLVHRAGLRARILTDGVIRVGDPIVVED
ncbi:MAG TPA: MOSC domain-containing protein [Candidatus Limnocylindrales bacterium]|nr:MOSC domain-containing protein [Candidatus Limnocylindrales bacterium]